MGRPLRLSPHIVRTALDSRANVAARTATGGPAPSEVERMLKTRRDWLSADETILAETTVRLRDAEARLENAVDGLIDVR